MSIQKVLQVGVWTAFIALNIYDFIAEPRITLIAFGITALIVAPIFWLRHRRRARAAQHTPEA